MSSGKVMRAMKDTGAQYSFLTREAAKLHKFPVVRSGLQLRVNGFNSCVSLTTDVVQIKVKFGNRFEKFFAIIVPEISTKSVIT